MRTILLFLFIGNFSFLTASWLDRKAEGWAWYEDKEEKEVVVEKPPSLIPVPLNNLEPKKTALQELAEVKKEVKEKLATAVLNPTEENVKQYMQIQKKWINQSEQFAKTWSRVLLNDPELDETVTGFPVSQYGIQLQKQLIQEKRERLINQLAKSHGLFFFYEGKNQVSQVFSVVVKDFAKRYGWKTIAISMDHVLIDGFENNKNDNGISEKFSVTVFPSLFIVNPQTFEVIPISFGLTSLDQIENNIETQFAGKYRL